MKTARNILSGLLMGYGFVSFFCFFVLDLMWSHAAPAHPSEALGFIYRHNEHGSYTYFSAFQATTCWLLSITSIPLAAVGFLIVPKKNVQWYAVRLTWDQDDPKELMKWAMVISMAATPLFVFFIGPYIVRNLNAAGFVMSFG